MAWLLYKPAGANQEPRLPMTQENVAMKQTSPANRWASGPAHYNRVRETALHDRIFAIAMCLLPFSLGEEIVVVSYSLPFFALLCLYYFAKIIGEPAQINKSVALILITSACIIAVMAVTSFIGPHPAKALSRVAIHANGLAMLFYFCTLQNTTDLATQEKRYYFLVRIFVTSGAIMGAYYLINFAGSALDSGLAATISSRDVGGLTSLPWGASNSVAAVLLIPLIVSLQLLAEVRPNATTCREATRFKRLRILDSLCTLIIVAAIISTFSRNAIVVAALLLGFFGLRASVIGMVTLAAIAGLVFLGLTFDADITAQLFEQRLRDRDELMSGNTRLYLWGLYGDYIKDNPFSPLGYYSSLFNFEFSSHNYSLTTYVEQSIVGWLLSAFLFVLLLSKSRQLSQMKLPNAKTQGQFIFFGMLMIALNLHFEDANFTHQYILYFWVFVSIFSFRFSISERRLQLLQSGRST